MLYVLDGSGFLFRSYYSLPPIVDKNWNNSWAIFWFFRMILKLLQEKPDNFIIAFDPGTKTKRNEEFKEYKANRPKIDDSFKKQIPIIIDICKKTWFDVEIVENYEADDVIASIVSAYKGKSVVVSSDKDLKQLIDDKVEFLEPKTMEYINKQKFIDEFNFKPSWMVLYLALLWDSSDNIPWVHGIWKKTAQMIVSKYDDIDKLFKNLQEFPPKIADKLKENKELIEKNIDLIKLYNIWWYTHDKIEEFSSLEKVDFKKLKDILVWEFGFNSFWNLIDKVKNELQQPTQKSLF